MRALICYDGSPDAQAAIDGAAVLLGGADATVLVIWETLLESLTRTGAMGMSYGMSGPYGSDGTDAALEQEAGDQAAEGTRRAAAAGFSAQPRIANRRDSIASAILAVAEEEDSDLVILGTRGRGGTKSLLLGSVSFSLLHHADRAVLVIPSTLLIEQRRKWADHAQLLSATSTQSPKETDRHVIHSS